MKVGDKVVCIKPTRSLVKHMEYMVTGIRKCRCALNITVGIYSYNGRDTMCYNCSTFVGDADDEDVFNSSRFRKVQPAKTNKVTRELVREFKEVEERIEQPKKVEI